MKDTLKIILGIFAIGFIVFLINQYIFQICFVQGDSMYPTIKSGSIVFIKKYEQKFDYNDIVVIKKNNKIIIKRIVGLPYDSIKIDNFLYINGQKKDSLYIENEGNIKEEISLKDNEYFVLGDNRQFSIDSRFNEIGIIHKNEIIGKTINI